MGRSGSPPGAPLEGGAPGPPWKGVRDPPKKGGCRDTKQCKFWRVSSVLIQGTFCFLGVRGGPEGGSGGVRKTLVQDVIRGGPGGVSAPRVPDAPGGCPPGLGFDPTDRGGAPEVPEDLAGWHGPKLTTETSTWRWASDAAAAT